MRVESEETEEGSGDKYNRCEDGGAGGSGGKLGRRK